MDVNFIVTCFNREDYWPFLKDIIDSYSVIKPHVAFCYNGDKGIKSDFHCFNRGKLEGETDLIIGGFQFLQKNGVKNWIKISVDSWLLDEDKILFIFNEMEKNNYCYAGCPWDDMDHFSTDIMFVRDTKFNFWEIFIAQAQSWIRKDNIEGLAAKIAKESGKYYLIPERSPANAPGQFRHAVEKLGWTMQHDLQKNIDFMKSYYAKG